MITILNPAVECLLQLRDKHNFRFREVSRVFVVLFIRNVIQITSALSISLGFRFKIVTDTVWL